MDHDPLTPLFSPLTTLQGVGPTVGALIAKAAGGERVIDLLFHLPESYVDRRQRPTIAAARSGQISTLAVIFNIGAILGCLCGGTELPYTASG